MILPCRQSSYSLEETRSGTTEQSELIGEVVCPSSDDIKNSYRSERSVGGNDDRRNTTSVSITQTTNERRYCTQRSGPSRLEVPVVCGGRIVLLVHLYWIVHLLSSTTVAVVEVVEHKCH